MSSRSRIRTRIDVGRLREAISGPGMDPRSWALLARVDDVEDAIRLEQGLGWIVDVTVTGGQLDGEGPIPCRVAWSYAGEDAGRSEPVERGTQVLVVLPDGDANGTPVIVGVLSTPDKPPPASINGDEVSEQYALSTHYLRTPHNVEQEVGSVWRVSAQTDAKLTAQNVALADDAPTQSYVRGDDQVDALKALIDALDAFSSALATAIPAPPNGALTVASVAAAYAVLGPQLATAKTSLEAALSTRIKGE